jgi:hypothetical protein
MEQGIRQTHPVYSLDGLVKGAGSRNVRDNGEGQGVGVVGVGISDFLDAGLGAHRAPDVVAGLEERVDDVGGNVARSSGHEHSLGHDGGGLLIERVGK